MVENEEMKTTWAQLFKSILILKIRVVKEDLSHYMGGHKNKMEMEISLQSLAYLGGINN